MSATANRRQYFNKTVKRIRLQRGLAFGIIIIGALLAFEIFNYSTTEFALNDLLGDLSFMGIYWSTILAIAFCGIDFAGIARLFTPEQGADEPTEIWYLFGAWMLAATMNAMLTWWGVSIALLNHQSLGNAVVEREVLLKVVPIFVAVMVWLIRVLIIGTFSVAGDRLFSQADRRMYSGRRKTLPVQSLGNRSSAQRAASSGSSFTPSPKPSPPPEPSYTRPEPTYHPVSMSPGSYGRKSSQVRR
jgi:hypothetical protein